jgi:hypothetical protein
LDCNAAGASIGKTALALTYSASMVYLAAAMEWVTPDIVAEFCGLSLGVILTGSGLGLVLWLLGWWSHRFWIVLATTVLAGVYGLQEAAALQTHPLIAGTLLAIAAGVLALHLVRLAAFIVGGVAALILVQSALPTLEQPLPVFIVAGLASLCLFRWFLMGLTSLLGATLLCYCGLALLNHRGVFDAVAWMEQGTPMINWVCGLMALMGFAFQFLFDRRGRRAHDDDGEEPATLFSFTRFYRRAG